MSKDKCTFEGKGPDGNSNGFAKKMTELQETGAKTPTKVSMSDWYYMIGHAEECLFCFNRFEELADKARESGPIDGPTTLRRS